MIESGEVTVEEETNVGEETNIEEGTIAQEDVVEYAAEDDVLKEVNYSTEKAIEDITNILGPGGESHWRIEGHYEQKDWDQMVNNPYSSPRLSIFFDEYKTYGDLDDFKRGVSAWLQTVAMTELLMVKFSDNIIKLELLS